MGSWRAVGSVGVAALPLACGWFDYEPVEDPIEEGLLGEIDGQAVASAGQGRFVVPNAEGGLDHYPFLDSDSGRIMFSTAEFAADPGSYPIAFGLILMPPDTPLSNHWLCSGEGSELLVKEDRVLEAGFEDLTEMGSCEGAPDGALSLRVITSTEPDMQSWEGSPELFLDGLSEMKHEGFIQTYTDHGRAFVSLSIPDIEDYGVTTAIDDVAIFTTDPTGKLLLFCAGSGSTMTVEEIVSEADTDYTTVYDLINVSAVGECPGTPLSGSLVWRELAHD
jgi:hypothetical protein